jgi:transcriptional regulator of heat shock response
MLRDNLKELLRIVVEEVTTTGEPVGSQYIVDQYDLDVSPATIRNWFTTLEEEGFLVQPHTSAGRVPTEKGYRLYLQELMKERVLRQMEFESLERAAMEMQSSSEELQIVANALSKIVEDAIVLVKRQSDVRSTGLARVLSQPEFSDQKKTVLFSDMIDHVHETLAELKNDVFDEPTAFIGTECPFGEDCGSVFLHLQNGVLIGVLGPMRMDYSRHFALMRTARKLLISI